MKDIDLKSHAIGMILKAVGVEPSLSGLIQAAGGKPEEVFQAVALTVEMAPKVITAVMEMDARMKRVELLLSHIVTTRADSGYHDAHHELPPEVTAALLAAAGA